MVRGLDKGRVITKKMVIGDSMLFDVEDHTQNHGKMRRNILVIHQNGNIIEKDDPFGQLILDRTDEWMERLPLEYPPKQC